MTYLHLVPLYGCVYMPAMQSPAMNAFSAAEKAVLERYGFNATLFNDLRRQLGDGVFSPENNWIEGRLRAPSAADMLPWPAPESAAYAELHALGSEAIAAGQVAMVTLNGGMATRFGGCVKGMVEVRDGLSFLGLRLQQLAAAGDRVHAFFMNSFATSEATQTHLREHANFGMPADRVHHLEQRISVRLRPDGEIFRDSKGQPSFYAPGHGDVFEVLAESEAFQAWLAGGGRIVMVGNVDNLGVQLDPVVIGAHLKSRKRVTVEVTERLSHDKGGAPVYVDDALVILEHFRAPPSFDMQAVPVFNTNTLTLNADAVIGDYPLHWFLVEKKVGGQPAVQFERLMGEVTSFVDSAYLMVPREGATGRFQPVKTPEDLERITGRAA